jgi:hypothetical protein
VHRHLAATLIAVMLAFWGGIASAQYDCTRTDNAGGFTLDCQAYTPTPEPTATSTATATPTATDTPTIAPTSTPVPATATATPIPPPNTPTPVVTVVTPIPSATPAPVSVLRVNVPLLDVVSGAPELDANNRAIVWGGQIADDGDYFQLRLVGSNSGLHLYSQQMRRYPVAGEQVSVTVNGRTFSTAYKQPGTWTQTERCGDGECRGWAGSIVIPWADLGGKPAQGDEWTLTARHMGAEWAGVMQWGERAEYAGTLPDGAVVLSLPLSADATLGGSTDCGANAWPAYFPTWGDANLEATKYGAWWTVQNQWDTADWPCYSRYIARWQLPTLPDGATVTGAWLDSYKFGHSGYAGESTGTNVMQAWQTSPTWQENAVTWNNAPLALEATSRTPVGECKVAECAVGDWHSFDVSEIVRRGYADGQAEASALMYSAAGQYHSGRYFYSREGALPPIVRIAYVLDPTPTPAPTATSTPEPSPTATATATYTPVPKPTATPQAATGKTLYVSPGQPYPWAQLYPGDTLILRDGTYPPMRPNARNGEPGKPITIRAEHDGKAVIDGKGQTAVQLGDTWPNVGEAAWWVVEGIVARNGGEAVWSIRGHDIVLRRVSGYDADPNGNSAIFWPYYSKNVLIEDCIAAGTGRKTIIIFSSEDVTVRRCYSDWGRWDGLTFCSVKWPGGNGIHIYNGHRVRVENSISLGPVPDRSLAITNQSDTATMTGIEVLGSIAAGAGRTDDGKPYPYPFPGAGACGNDANYTFYPGENAGLVVYGQGPIIAPVFRDVLATNNAREGFGIIRPYGTGGQDVILDHATLYGNGQDLRPDGELTVTNSCVGSEVCTSGGARLENRYIDGQLTDIPLLPFNMEQRGRDELGISISDIWAGYAGR